MSDIVTTAEMRDIIREQAERIILSHASDIESLSISEMLEDLELPEAEHDELCDQVDKAISAAPVTVSWPAEPTPSQDATGTADEAVA